MNNEEMSKIGSTITSDALKINNATQKKPGMTKNSIALFVCIFSGLFLGMSPICAMIYNVVMSELLHSDAKLIDIGNLLSLAIGVIGGSLSTILAFYFHSQNENNVGGETN